MGTMLDAFRGLTSRQIAVLAAVLIGSAVATYGAYALISDSGGSGLGENQQTVSVQYGNLVKEVSTNGSLVFPIRETLTFGTQGTVEAILVEEGQQVEEGQLLVSLDAATVASLEKAVAQARVSLRNAEDNLAAALNSHTALELAQVEANVANAKLAESAAQEALDEVKDGPTADDIAASQSQVDAASVSLANAQGDLDIALKEWDVKVQEAEDASLTSMDIYRAVFDKWLGISLGEEDISVDPDTLLDFWGIDLDYIYNNESGSQDIGNGVWSGWTPPSDDPATLWNEITVYYWLNFYPVAIVATCEDQVVSSQEVCVAEEMQNAWDAYQGLMENLVEVELQASKAVASADSAVTKAEDSQAAAQETLADIQAGPNSLEVDVKEKQLAVAQANLAEAEDALAEMLNGIDPLDLALVEADVAVAQLNLDTAIEQLDGASIESPTSGVVALVNMEAGQTVNANTTIIEIIDPRVVELDGIVDEIDVLLVRQGARAEVSMDALPGRVLDGIVSFVDLVPQNSQGVVSYPIRIRVEMPEGVSLLEGLSATASIVLSEELDVMLVPTQSIYGSFQQPLVQVVSNGRVEDRPVTLGDNDGFWIVVTGGLAEGEMVVMEATAASTNQFGGFGAFGGGRGGFTGGGGFGGGGGAGGGR